MISKYRSTGLFLCTLFITTHASAAKVGCPSMTGEQVRLTTCENKTMTLTDNFTYTIAPEHEQLFTHCSALMGRRNDKIQGVLRDMRTSNRCTYQVPKKWQRHFDNIKEFSIVKKKSVITCPKLNFAVVYAVMNRAESENTLDSSGSLWKLDKVSQKKLKEALVKFNSAHGKYAKKVATRLRYRLSTLRGIPDITYKTCLYSLKSWGVILNGVPKESTSQQGRKARASTKGGIEQGA